MKNHTRGIEWEKLRGSYVKKAVYNQNNNLIAPIEMVNILND